MPKPWSLRKAPLPPTAEEDIDWKTVAAADALKAVGGSDVQILDVRDNDTYAEGHLKGSLQSSLKEIEDPAAQTAMYKMAKEEMDPSKPVYLLQRQQVCQNWYFRYEGCRIRC